MSRVGPFVGSVPECSSSGTVAMEQASAAEVGLQAVTLDCCMATLDGGDDRSEVRCADGECRSAELAQGIIPPHS